MEGSRVPSGKDTHINVVLRPCLRRVPTTTSRMCRFSIHPWNCMDCSSRLVVDLPPVVFHEPKRFTRKARINQFSDRNRRVQCAWQIAAGRTSKRIYSLASSRALVTCNNGKSEIRKTYARGHGSPLTMRMVFCFHFVNGMSPGAKPNEMPTSFTSPWITPQELW